MTRLQRSFSDYCRSVAEWRRQRYDDPHRDARNLRGAEGLEEFATFVLELPDDDPRLAKLAELAAYDGEFTPGQQVAWEVARFRFYHAHGSCDAFLTHLTELAEKDSTEHGRFGGTMAPGDDPWEEEEELPYHGGASS
jgi:hypothetical protein